MKVIVLCFILLAGCATGNSIVTGTVRPETSPESVKVLLEPPAKYETIGIVSAESLGAFGSQAMQDHTVAELKAQAAKLGANAVILREMGDRNATTVGFTRHGGFFSTNPSRPTLKGEAIWVP